MYKLKIPTNSGTPHIGKSIESSLQYIEKVFSDYKKYSGVNCFTGKVAEIGPGDSCGVGLLFLLDGCESVDLVDRFYSYRDSRQQAGIYQALIKRYPVLLSTLLNFDVNDEQSFRGLLRFYGESAAAECFFVQNDYYDYIVSRAVLEHIYNPYQAIEKMVKALKNNGMLLHKVDLRDHGMFSDYFHELSYFNVSDTLYPHLTRDAGRPNRILINNYREILNKFIPNHKILITHLAGVGDIYPHVPYNQIDNDQRNQSLDYVKSVRNSFSSKLRSISDEDLSVTGIFIVAIK